MLCTLPAAVLCFPAQEDFFSDKAKVSVITVGPSQQTLYYAFGHSIIRIEDPDRDFDAVYDFGVFSFDQDDFILNYVLGNLVYRMGKVRSFLPIRLHYQNEGRYLREQVLELNRNQVEALYLDLEENYRPENRNYIYNYYYNNCSTQVRDVIEKAVEVKYDPGFVTKGKTFRHLSTDYLKYQPWGRFGVNAALGSQIDRVMEPRDYMFIPDYVYYSFANATYSDGGRSAALVRSTSTIFPGVEPSGVSLFTPFNFFLVVFLAYALLTLRNIKYAVYRPAWDILLFSVVGLFGSWLLFLWVGTMHISKENYNLIWAIPLHLPLALFLLSRGLRRMSLYYFRGVAAVYILFLLAMAFLPQDIPLAVVPLVLAMLIRCLWLGFLEKHARGV